MTAILMRPNLLFLPHSRPQLIKISVAAEISGMPGFLRQNSHVITQAASVSLKLLSKQ